MSEQDELDRAAAEAKQTPWIKRNKAQRDAIYQAEKRKHQRIIAQAKEVSRASKPAPRDPAEIAEERRLKEERRRANKEAAAEQRRIRADQRRANAAAAAAAAPARSSIRARFEGAVLDGTKGTVTYKGTTVPLPATARVETAGQIRERVTATRLVLVGVFAFAFKKKKDSRELYLTVEGDGAAFVMELKPDLGHKARSFAAQVNAA